MARKKTVKENPEEPQKPDRPSTIDFKKENFMKPRQILSIAIAVAVLVIAAFSMSNIFENLDAGKVMVIQSPVSGSLTWHTTPGLKYQGFGMVTDYPRRSQFWFSHQKDQGKETDESLPIRFNDGGQAHISGGLSWEMPLSEEHLNLLHQKYGSLSAIEQQLIRPIVEKSLYLSGPLMSSTESYAARKNELLHIIEDQINNGIYQTKTINEVQKDPITGTEKNVSVVQLVLDKEGKPLRNDESPLKEFKVRIFNFTINKVKYDSQVEEQIQKQQKSIMDVQVAILELKKAEQQVLTTIKEGQSSAAKAEWVQKTINIKQTTEADARKQIAEIEAAQKLEVARLDAEAAQQYKLSEIAKGEGESQRRKLVLDADGALEKKLEAYVEVQKAYAKAIADHKNSFTPQVIMGQNAQATNGAQTLIDLFTTKAAKDLGLEMSLPKSK